MSPSLKEEAEYVELFVPTVPPFNCHSYTGALPPLRGAAVNVMLVPGQTVVDGLAVIFTPGVNEELITVVIAFDVAGLDVTHVALDVITQVITSLFDSVVEE